MSLARLSAFRDIAVSLRGWLLQMSLSRLTELFVIEWCVCGHQAQPCQGRLSKLRLPRLLNCGFRLAFTKPPFQAQSKPTVFDARTGLQGDKSILGHIRRSRCSSCAASAPRLHCCKLCKESRIDVTHALIDMLFLTLAGLVAKQHGCAHQISTHQGNSGILRRQASFLQGRPCQVTQTLSRPELCPDALLSKLVEIGFHNHPANAVDSLGAGQVGSNASSPAQGKVVCLSFQSMLLMCSMNSWPSMSLEPYSLPAVATCATFHTLLSTTPVSKHEKCSRIQASNKCNPTRG